MSFIAAIFIMAPHNPIAAFLAAGITVAGCGYVVIGVKALHRLFNR